MSETNETPDRYKPDHKGKYSVRESEKNNWNGSSTRIQCEIGGSVLDALGAEGGDKLVFRENDNDEMVVEVEKNGGE